MDTQRRLPDPEITPWLSIPEAGGIFGLGRAASYQAAQRGEIPTVPLGKRRLVPTAVLRAMFGLGEARVTSPSHPRTSTNRHVKAKEAS